jgi:hypothetical protein
VEFAADIKVLWIGCFVQGSLPPDKLAIEFRIGCSGGLFSAGNG